MDVQIADSMSLLVKRPYEVLSRALANLPRLEAYRQPIYASQ